MYVYLITIFKKMQLSQLKEKIFGKSFRNTFKDKARYNLQYKRKQIIVVIAKYKSLFPHAIFVTNQNR